MNQSLVKFHRFLSFLEILVSFILLQILFNLPSLFFCLLVVQSQIFAGESHIPLEASLADLTLVVFAFAVLARSTAFYTFVEAIRYLYILIRTVISFCCGSRDGDWKPFLLYFGLIKFLKFTKVLNLVDPFLLLNFSLFTCAPPLQRPSILLSGRIRSWSLSENRSF